MINSNLPSILHRFQVTANYVKFSLATGGRYTLTPSKGRFPANIAIIDIPLKTRFFGLHFTCRMYWCIFNHFSVTGPQSHRMRRNNVNHTVITPLRSFKVTDFGTNQKPICDFLLMITTNLPPISRRFQVIADYWSNFRYRYRGTSLLRPRWG